MLGGVLLTAAPAVATPPDAGPPSSLVRAKGAAADDVALAPSAVTVQGTSDAPGEVELSISVSSTDGLVTAGTVTVWEGDVALQADIPLVAGLASYQDPDVVPGAHRYRVSYSGTDAIAPAESEIIVDVRDRVAATLKVTASSPRIGVARLDVVVVTVDRSLAAGSLEVREEGAGVATTLPVVNSLASFEKSGVKPGRHRYVLTYSGTANVQPSSKTVTVDVRDKAVAVLAVSSTSSAVGKLTLRVGVTAEGKAVSGGTVTIKEGTRTVKSKIAVTRGVATWSATGLRSGKHTYVVTYRGTAKVKGATTTYVATVKAKAKPVLTLSASSPGPKKVSLKVTVKASGQPGLGGSVKITEGAKTVKSKIAVKKGKASWSASAVKPGRHTYTVTYGGTSQVASGSAKVSVTVKKPVVIKTYQNCTKLNAVWPHGVGRPGAEDEVSGSTDPVTDFLRNTKLYNKNTGSDRDKDGIACEKL